MQTPDTLLRKGRYILIASMLLMIVSIAPASQATSLAPAIDPGSDQSTQAEAPANSALSREAMKFLEDNWYFDYRERDNQTESQARNPAPESDLDEFDFDAMERYPGLYTAPHLDEFDFDAMERYPGLYTDPFANEGSSDTEDTDLALKRDRIKFLEDNWHFDRGDLFPQDDVSESSADHSDERNADHADSLDELENGTSDADSSADRSQGELTYPWGGFQEDDY
jgi:hypothetical protein